jgi:uncharacterized membrane protein YhaH (DUF805 family)
LAAIGVMVRRGGVVNFGQAIGSGFKKYVDFNGRASRSEYWFFFLFLFLVSLPFSIMESIMQANGSSDGAGAFTLVLWMISLATFLPSLAIFVRRLHDVDRSGWWCFIILTIVGVIPLLIWLCRAGAPGPNRFGGNPLSVPGPQASTANVWES